MGQSQATPGTQYTHKCHTPHVTAIGSAWGALHVSSPSGVWGEPGEAPDAHEFGAFQTEKEAFLNIPEHP